MDFKAPPILFRNREYTFELQFYDCVYGHLTGSVVFRIFPNLYGSGKKRKE